MFVKPGDVIQLIENHHMLGAKGEKLTVYCNRKDKLDDFGYGKTKEERSALVSKDGAYYGGVIANHPDVIKYLRIVHAKPKYKRKHSWD